MKKRHSLRRSLTSSHILVSLIPLFFISLFFLLFIVQNLKDDFMVRIDLLSKGINGQIQLFINQPLASLNTISSILNDSEETSLETSSKILNSYIREILYFESIYLLNSAGDVVSAGLPIEREHSRNDLLGISLGHKKEFQSLQVSGQPAWSDTFLSLVSGTISLTLYVPTGNNVLAADINLNTLAQFISRLNSETVLTMVIDRNGAIMFHPNPKLVGKRIMVNNIDLVTAALNGDEKIGQFSLNEKNYLGSTSIIIPTGWISLIAQPMEHFYSSMTILLSIIGSGIVTAVVLSLILAFFRARRLAKPLTEITLKSSIIAQGNFTTPLPPNDFNELQQLTDSINSMVKAIQKREVELLENEQKYRELVENTSNLVLRLDSELNITYSNHTLQDLTNIPISKAFGLPFQQCIIPEDWPRLEKSIAAWVTSHQKSDTIECRTQDANGTRHHLLLSCNMHYDTKGSLIDFNIIGHDMTSRYQFERQQKELEQKRQQSQKMEFLGLMAGGVAHDLNNILAGIINYPEILLLKLDQESSLRRPLESIKKSGERAAAVVADLLTVARDSAVVHEPTNLNQLLSNYFNTPEFIQLQNNYPQVTFTFSPNSELFTCRCSPVHIEKTLMNLVINGFESIIEQGQVDVSTANLHIDSSIDLGYDIPQGQYVTFSIRDTGNGISEEDQKRIFDPFFTKKELGRSGTGLGLTVAWNSVREHGGTITVNSSSNGTLFTVILPVNEDNLNLEKLHDSEGQLQGSGEHILVVDDEEILRDIAVNMLEILGYQASSVSSGEEALDYLHTRKADLILLDMLMDPGINGRETYMRIKQLNPDQKALIATGYSTNSDVEATLMEGAGAFIKKPFNLESLGRAVYAVLHGEQKKQ